MKIFARMFSIFKVFLPTVLVILLVGCATTSRIDWNSRIHNFTYDQAIIELGPPDKSAKLADGSIVAEWLTHRGYAARSFGPPVVYVDPRYYGPIYPSYIDAYSPDYYLRLIFGPDGQLRSWKKFAK